MKSRHPAIRKRRRKNAAIIRFKKMLKRVMWHEWNDPVRSRVVEKEIPGESIMLPISWKPGKTIDMTPDFNPGHS